MKRQITHSFFTAMLFASAIFVSCNSGEAPKSESAATDSTAVKDSTATGTAMYVCPMHPEEKSENPGKCGKCGMDLEKKS